MRIPLLILFIVLSYSGYSQELVVTTTYYDINDVAIGDKDKSHHYVVDSTVGNLNRSDGFYTSNGRVMFVQETGQSDANKRRIYFYPTGEVMAKGTFMGFNPTEVFVISYPNGKPLAEIEFRDHSNDDGLDFIIRHYWDPAGNKVIDGGNGKGNLIFPVLDSRLSSGEGSVVKGYKDGIWKGTSRDGAYEETYKNGVIVDGVMRKDGNEYSYKKIEQTAEFPGGMQAMMNHIAKNMKYPPKARNANAEGTAFIEFEVIEDGTVSNVKVLKRLHPELDKEGLRVVSTFPKWKPAFYRGVPVKIRFILPVKFVLG